jgi:hypothetical protein
MECTKPIADLFAPWTQAQQSFWERLRAAGANGTAPADPTGGLWNLPLEFWKVAIYESLDIQLAAAEAWKAWVCATDANIPEITIGACQVAHFVEDWTRTQMQLWDSWFGALERLAPGPARQPAARRVEKPRAHEHAGRPAGNGVPA